MRGLSCSASCGILVPILGIEPTFPAFQGGFLTTGPPGKPLSKGLLDFGTGGATPLSCELSCVVEMHGKLGIGEMSWKSLLVGGPRLVPVSLCICSSSCLQSSFPVSYCGWDFSHQGELRSISFLN